MLYIPLKKEARQENSSNLKRGNVGIANMTGDKIGIPDGWVIYWLGDAVTPVVPLGRHANASPIFSQHKEVYPEPAELSNYTLGYGTCNMFCTFMCTHKYLIKCRNFMWGTYIGLVLACLPGGTTGVTASPSRYMTHPSGIPILSPVLFMHVCDPYIPPFKNLFTCVV